jgi:oligopeptide/dipeptide ABC transporter ATP-binding protein
MSTERPLLEVDKLTKYFPVTRGVFGRVAGHVRAVDGVSFDIAKGETLGLVGESGSGKTTAGRSLLRLIEPTSGTVRFDGIDVLAASSDELRKLRRRMQIIFQDPYGSLNPRMRVIDIVGEALELHGLARGADVEKRVASLLGRVGLSPSWINRYPHEFSGGQRQRIGVARAIALEPDLIVCDEPVSALDVSIQAQVVNLLKDLGSDLGLSYLFIAHDLSVVRHISDRVAVMYLGEIVEVATSKALFRAPGHPYTRALLSAIPVPDPKRRVKRLVLAGDIPSPLNPPPGCRFHTRCPAVFDRCRVEVPKHYEVEPGHLVQCFHAEGVSGDDYPREVDARIERALHVESADPVSRTWLADAARETQREISAEPPAKEDDAVPAPERRAKRSLSARESKVLIALLVLVTIVGFAVARRSAAQTRAERQLQVLAHELTEFARITGRYPTRLRELGFRLPPIFPDKPLADPWGNEVRYRLDTKGKRPRFELESLGPDGVDSTDDIVVTSADKKR